MRPDYQDYQGTGLTVEVARELDVPPNDDPHQQGPRPHFDTEQIRENVSRTYNCPVAAVIPHSDRMMGVGQP